MLSMPVNEGHFITPERSPLQECKNVMPFCPLLFCIYLQAFFSTWRTKECPRGGEGARGKCNSHFPALSKTLSNVSFCIFCTFALAIFKLFFRGLHRFITFFKDSWNLHTTYFGVNFTFAKYIQMWLVPQCKILQRFRLMQHFFNGFFDFF